MLFHKKAALVCITPGTRVYWSAISGLAILRFRLRTRQCGNVEAVIFRPSIRCTTNTWGAVCAINIQVSGACRRRRPLLGVPFVHPGESRRIYLKDLLSNSLDCCSMYDNKYSCRICVIPIKLEAGDILALQLQVRRPISQQGKQDSMKVFASLSSTMVATTTWFYRSETFAGDKSTAALPQKK